MFKKIIATVFVVLFGLSAAFAADDAPAGKVLAIEGNTVRIEVSGEMPTWARKGGYLRAVTADGKLLLRGAKIINVEAGVITVTTTKAGEMKVGDPYTLGKGKASAGC